MPRIHKKEQLSFLAIRHLFAQKTRGLPAPIQSGLPDAAEPFDIFFAESGMDSRITNVLRSMKPPDDGIKEIALAFPIGISHMHQIAEGIRDYAAGDTRWRFVMCPESHNLPPSALEGWEGDGVIALCNTADDQRVLAELRCPAVNISGAFADSVAPRVHVDYRQIGARAASHLRQRGFRRFGFYGVADVWYSEQIELGFREAVQAFGLTNEALHCNSTLGPRSSWGVRWGELESWLLSMERPFAVMAANDPRAAMVIRACERIGLKVPEEVAVIGNNDDLVYCETCHPTLTSVARNSHEVGLRAAEMLDHLMQGKPAPREIIVPAGEVRERESTRTLAIEHPAVRKAVRFIEAEYRRNIGVEQIAGACGRSRRWLENAFREELQCPPAEVLEQIRIRVVLVRLADDPSRHVGNLALETGFSGARRLHATFHRRMGMSIKEFVAVTAGSGNSRHPDPVLNSPPPAPARTTSARRAGRE